MCHGCSKHAITGVSTYNVVPDKSAYYFNKIQCFCFEEQRLRAGEEVDMPVFFYIDPELVDDFNCRCAASPHGTLLLQLDWWGGQSMRQGL